MNAIFTIVAVSLVAGIITTSIFIFLIIFTMQEPKIIPFLVENNSLHITINSEEHQNKSELFILDFFNDELEKQWRAFFMFREFESVVCKKITKPLDNQKNIFVVIIK